MSDVRLYIDHHVSSAITEGLRSRNIDCLTAEEDLREAWHDEDLLQRATSLGRAIVTQDEDFLAIGAKWNNANRNFAGIVYSH